MEQSLVDLARDTATAGSDFADVRRLGELAAWVSAYEQATFASTHEIATGRTGPDYSSIIKMLCTQIQTAVHEQNLAVLGASAEIMTDHGPNGEMLGMRRNYWHGRGAEIYAGSNEIQRNIISERLLGLPREPRG
jgi:alkylation response protein AidB-like acyl-CoA dehydrogenase